MKISIRKWMLPCWLLAAGFLQAGAQNLPAVPPPDNRYKADILLVIAHPDDDTNVSTYLWKAVLDEGKRVAVVFTTRGSTGGNIKGMEQGKALAYIREIEARRALAAYGITNVWFLQGIDTPTQDVLHSLETLGHGEAMDDMVRIVRLTRPEVILTWLPAYVYGENHGDHQAAAVVAIEAFDLAGNPAAFPEQITAPRDRLGISNYGEGLHPWQAKKLYFFSDATHPEIFSHHGPTYSATDISRSRGVPFSQLNKIACDFYRTQIDSSDEIIRINKPDYLILGKSLVAAPMEGDVFAGIGQKPIAYAPSLAYHESQAPPLSLELGGPWAFYHDFYRVHGLVSLETLVKPQSAFIPGNSLWVPLLLRNTSQEPFDVTLHSSLPEGWRPAGRDVAYRLGPNSTYPLQIFLQAPTDVKEKVPQVLRWSMTANGKRMGEVELPVYPESIGLPQ